MSGAKTSLIWLHADPPFPFIWNRRKAQQFGVLEGKTGYISIQNKLWDFQFHISGNLVHSRVVSHCANHNVLTQTNFCLISFNSKTSDLYFPHIGSLSWNVSNHKLLQENISCVGWCGYAHIWIQLKYEIAQSDARTPLTMENKTSLTWIKWYLLQGMLQLLDPPLCACMLKMREGWRVTPGGGGEP